MFGDGGADDPGVAALHEGAGAVDRIDDEDLATGEPRRIVDGLLRQPAEVRPRRAEPLLQEAVDGDVGLGHRRGMGLCPGPHAAPGIVERHGAGLVSQRLQEVAQDEIVSVRQR